MDPSAAVVEEEDDMNDWEPLASKEEEAETKQDNAVNNANGHSKIDSEKNPTSRSKRSKMIQFLATIVVPLVVVLLAALVKESKQGKLQDTPTMTAEELAMATRERIVKAEKARPVVKERRITATMIQPQLEWNLQGVNATKDNYHDNGAPFVIIEEILPVPLLEATLAEIERSIVTMTATFQSGRQRSYVECKLRSSGKEQWMNMSGSAVLSGNTDDAWPPPKDVLEQAIVYMAQADLKHVLPAHIAKAVTGVSWRVLLGEPGFADAVFHYDSDEGTDYALPETPMIYPLLSTVTYLTNYGEPTLILEQTQLLFHDDDGSTKGEMDNGSHEKIVHLPSAAYVSMPKTNKHIAFDPRLFHGASAPITTASVQEIRHQQPEENFPYRIAIGLNFHTSRSMETINDEEDSDDDDDDDDEAAGKDKVESWDCSTPELLDGYLLDLAPPVPLSAEDQIYHQQHVWNVKPWNPKDIFTAEQLKNNKDTSSISWEYFDLITSEEGFDFCGAYYAPCRLTMRLPIQHILKLEAEAAQIEGGDDDDEDSDDEDEDSTIAAKTTRAGGITIGFELKEKDFQVRQILRSVDKDNTKYNNRASHNISQVNNKMMAQTMAQIIATEMLQQRCHLYKHQKTAMNPPLNHLC